MAIVEDDPEQAAALERMVLGCSGDVVFSITCFSSVADLEDFMALKKNRLADGGGALDGSGVEDSKPDVDIVLMDIRFGGEDRTGIDAVAALFPSGCGTQVVYVTGYPDFCTEVYRTDHIYFLTKPVAPADLSAALEKALLNIERSGNGPIGISVGNRFVRLLPRKILYVESDRRKVRIHMADATVLEAYLSLGALAGLLPASFAQCHKSFLVNMVYVSELQSDAVLLLSGELVPMSRARRRQMKELFALHLRAGM